MLKGKSKGKKGTLENQEDQMLCRISDETNQLHCCKMGFIWIGIL